MKQVPVVLVYGSEGYVLYLYLGSSLLRSIDFVPESTIFLLDFGIVLKVCNFVAISD